MYCYCNHLLPRSYDNVFVSGFWFVFVSIHQYETRTAQNLRPHQCRTTLKSHTITYQGPVYWNSLNDNIKNQAKLSSFKSQLKVSLLKKYSI
jgi:hypothetical protein